MSPLQRRHNRINVVDTPTPSSAAGAYQCGPEPGVSGEFFVRGQCGVGGARLQFNLGTTRFPKARGVAHQIQ